MVYGATYTSSYLPLSGLYLLFCAETVFLATWQEHLVPVSYALCISRIKCKTIFDIIMSWYYTSLLGLKDKP